MITKIREIPSLIQRSGWNTAQERERRWTIARSMRHVNREHLCVRGRLQQRLQRRLHRRKCSGRTQRQLCKPPWMIRLVSTWLISAPRSSDGQPCQKWRSKLGLFRARPRQIWTCTLHVIRCNYRMNRISLHDRVACSSRININSLPVALPLLIFEHRHVLSDHFRRDKTPSPTVPPI